MRITIFSLGAACSLSAYAEALTLTKGHLEATLVPELSQVEASTVPDSEMKVVEPKGDEPMNGPSSQDAGTINLVENERNMHLMPNPNAQPAMLGQMYGGGGLMNTIANQRMGGGPLMPPMMPPMMPQVMPQVMPTAMPVPMPMPMQAPMVNPLAMGNFGMGAMNPLMGGLGMGMPVGGMGMGMGGIGMGGYGGMGGCGGGCASSFSADPFTNLFRYLGGSIGTLVMYGLVAYGFILLMKQRQQGASNGRRSESRRLAQTGVEVYDSDQKPDLHSWERQLAQITKEWRDKQDEAWSQTDLSQVTLADQKSSDSAALF